MTSSKQIEANRQNAQQSTGPRSEEGKAIVAGNAVKHGIFAREAVITSGDRSEDQAAYAQLYAGLIQDLGAQGMMEELLVEKIAVNYWRLRRLIRYETGEVSERMESIMEDAAKDRHVSAESYLKSTTIDPSPMEYFSYGDNVAEDQVEAQRDLVSDLTLANQPLSDEPGVWESIWKTKLGAEAPDKPLPRNWREQVSMYLSGLSPQLLGKLRKEMLAREEQILEEMEEVSRWNRKVELLARLRAIPRAHDVDKVIKYETALERSIFRNLQCLRELQQSRGGRDKQQQPKG